MTFRRLFLALLLAIAALSISVPLFAEPEPIIIISDPCQPRPGCNTSPCCNCHTFC